jgi:hypothetical protein
MYLSILSIVLDFLFWNIKIGLKIKFQKFKCKRNNGQF